MVLNRRLYLIIGLLIEMICLCLNDQFPMENNLMSYIRRAKQETSSECVCGSQHLSTRSNFKTQTDYHFTWLIPLIFRNGTLFCSGTLINSKYVLTAAHCFRYSKEESASKGELRKIFSSDAIFVPEIITNEILVGIGIHNLTIQKYVLNAKYPFITSSSPKPYWLQIDYAIVHRYYKKSIYGNQNDIALIRLKQDLNFVHNKWLSPICLPDANKFDFQFLHKYVRNIPTNKPGSNQANYPRHASTYSILDYSLDTDLGAHLYNNSKRTNSKLLNLNETNLEYKKQFILNNSIRISKKYKTLHPDEKDYFDEEDEEELNDENNLIQDIDKIVTLETFYSIGWGSNDMKLSRISQIPLYAKIELADKNVCNEIHKEFTNDKFLCAKKDFFEKVTNVGDSGGPLFARMKNFYNPNINSNLNDVHKLDLTTYQSVTTNNYTRDTFKVPLIEPTTPKILTSRIPSIKVKASIKTKLNQVSTTVPSITRSTPKLPLKEVQQLLDKLQQNHNHHFYSANIHDDLLKGNFSFNQLDSIEMVTNNLTRNLIQPNILKKSRLELKLNSTDHPNKLNKKSKQFMNIKNLDSDPNRLSINMNLDNYVQLGIISWGFTDLQSNLHLYTDVRFYLDWIKENTIDGLYCATNLQSRSLNQIEPTTTIKTQLSESLIYSCGAPRLNQIDYPWLVSIYYDDKFLGNGLYFFANFVISSDIFFEQMLNNMNRLISKLSVQFFYPNYKFRVRYLVNTILPKTSLNRKEYVVIQLEDNQNLLQQESLLNRRNTRTSIENQLNYNNANAVCIVTRTYNLDEEHTQLLSYYLYIPTGQLIITKLKLISFRKCFNLSPTFVSRRYLCTEVISMQEINLDQNIIQNLNKHVSYFETDSKFNLESFVPKKKNNSFGKRILNFFRLNSTRINKELDLNLINFNQTINHLNTTFKISKSLNLSAKQDLFEGQPLLHLNDDQYTLLGFHVKPPFPLDLTFRRKNYALFLNLQRYRFQIVSKLLRSLRTTSSNSQ